MVIAAGTVPVAVQVIVAVVVILRVLHVIHSGGKSSSGDGCGTLVQ